MLEEHCSAAVVELAEQGEWPDALWKTLEEASVPLAWVDEAEGGAGASLADGFAIARIAGRFAAPVPLAETLLAGWTLSQAGLGALAGPLAVAPTRSADQPALDAQRRLSGVVRRVPYAAACAHLVLVARHQGGAAVAAVPLDPRRVTRGSSISGEPLDDVDLDGLDPDFLAVELPEDLMVAQRRVATTLRAQQIAGALESILDLSLRYAGERQQFGRPIGKFQAVQHNLAVLAGEAAAAGAAADAAAIAIERFGAQDARSFRAVAAAKIRAGEAAGSGAAIAHQVHGAIGFTREYSLQQRTRRLWSWRDDFGTETEWADELGRAVVAAGADNLWAELTA